MFFNQLNILCIAYHTYIYIWKSNSFDDTDRTDQRFVYAAKKTERRKTDAIQQQITWSCFLVNFHSCSNNEKITYFCFCSQFSALLGSSVSVCMSRLLIFVGNKQIHYMPLLYLPHTQQCMYTCNTRCSGDCKKIVSALYSSKLNTLFFFLFLCLVLFCSVQKTWYYESVRG